MPVVRVEEPSGPSPTMSPAELAFGVAHGMDDSALACLAVVGERCPEESICICYKLTSSVEPRFVYNRSQARLNTALASDLYIPTYT